jgi:hypothetical protein
MMPSLSAILILVLRTLWLAFLKNELDKPMGRCPPS